MDGGTLKCLVSIRQRGTTQDAAGQPVESWTEVLATKANIRQRTGAEAIRADKDTSIVQTSIRIRRRPAVTAAMRVYHGTTVYEIKAVLDDVQHRERMDLVCEVVR